MSEPENGQAASQPGDSLLANAEVRLNPQGIPERIRCRIPLASAGIAADTGFESAEPADEVRNFLAAHAAELQLPAGSGDLEKIQDVTTAVQRTVRYQQHHEGLPVLDRNVVVQIDPAGNVKQLDLHHEPESRMSGTHLEQADSPPELLAPAAALETAIQALDKPELRFAPPTPQLAYYPMEENLRKAWVANIPTRNPAHDWRVVLDAQSGEVLSKDDLLKHLDGKGLVFDPNPVVTSNNPYLRDPAASSGASPLQAIDAERVDCLLRDLTFAEGGFRLEGPYVKLVNFSAPNHALPRESSAAGFNYSSADPRFDAVNVYYHVDAIQRYIQSLGITTAHNRPISADPHDNSSGGGAFFSPFDGGLHFGDSGMNRPNRASDADVILHEYGHAIQADQVPGWGNSVNPITHRPEARAMGEGFGDILACVFFAEKGDGFQREIFEDWIFADVVGTGLRRVDGSKKYPADWMGEEHEDGEIWSGALWEIFLAIGGSSTDPGERLAARDALLKTLILSHHKLQPNASMPDGAEAILDTHNELPEYLGKYTPEMLSVFRSRGILKDE